MTYFNQQLAEKSVTNKTTSIPLDFSIFLIFKIQIVAEENVNKINVEKVREREIVTYREKRELLPSSLSYHNAKWQENEREDQPKTLSSTELQFSSQCPLSKQFVTQTIM
uniref:(northern house mosquito) hypothetical protein n=1 Tax=Culex pipiens TaxID=7175 RepID=A0A8D8E5R2_CULPI